MAANTLLGAWWLHALSGSGSLAGRAPLPGAFPAKNAARAQRAADLARDDPRVPST
jgi:hypothetical protein